MSWKRFLPASGKRGIALVVVLGMLALLVMMGVAFSVLTRTERQAAGSFLHDVRARQLLFAAQAQALETLETNLVGKAYPEWVALSSLGTNGIPLSSPADIWCRHIPDNLLLDPDNSAKLNPQLPKVAGWQNVANGRVAFLIVNTSGLIDGNIAGGKPRMTGTDPGEIDLTGMTDVSDAARFISRRPYESVSQMKRATNAIGLFRDTCITDYSMSPTNFTPAPTDLSGSAADLTAKRAEIVAALTTYFQPINAAMTFDALLDYVDADSIPQNLNAPCTERVPMINEVKVKPMLLADVPSASVRLRFLCTVEFAYPFVTPKPGSYSLDYSFTVTPATPVGLTVNSPIEGSVATINFVGAPFTAVNFTPAVETLIPCASYPGQEARFNIVFTYLRVKDASGNVVDQVNGLKIGLANRSDQFPAIVIPAAPVSVLNGIPGGTECADPRFNYLTTGYWLPYAMIASGFGGNATMSTNGSISPATTNYYASFYIKNGTTDGHPWMHVADQPLQSVTELSYLIRGAASPTPLNSAWKTLRLLNEGAGKADPIMKYFKVPPPTVTSLRGFVNPNTDVPEVLAACMRKMVLDRSPGDTLFYNTEMTVSSDQALTLADAWLSDTNSTNYYSVADLNNNSTYSNAVARLINLQLPAINSIAADRNQARDFRREAAFRNLLGLFNPRQNYFTIILFSQSTASVELPRVGDAPRSRIDTIRADQTALLQVWRDPVSVTVTNEVTEVVNTYHPMFIRRFEILSQE